MQRLVTQTQYASIAHVSQQVVAEAIAVGKLKSYVGGRIDLDEANEWRKNVRPKVSKRKQEALVEKKLAATSTPNPSAAVYFSTPTGEPPCPPPSPVDANSEPLPDYQEVRTRRELAEARLSELKLAQQRGELINKAAVQRAVSVGFKQLKDIVLATPDKLAMDRQLQIQLRNALAAAFSDALKIMPKIDAQDD